MAEGGHSEELSMSTLKGSEDGGLSHTILTEKEYLYEHYCEPCDGDDIHVDATFYCRNCKEYMCKKCSKSHKRFKQSSDHDIPEVLHMTHKPAVSKKKPRVITRASHVKDIEVEESIYNFALMSTNQLLATGYLNSTVILVDISSGKQISEMALSGWPWQVTKISDTEAAVTIPDDKKIVLLKTNPKLSVVWEISVKGECYGIAHMDNKLIVTFEEGHLDMLDMSGKVLRTISVNKTGKKIFIDPVYVTVNPLSGCMYVSDQVDEEKDRLVKLSMEGRVMATYTFNTQYNCQVALDSQGMIYLICTNKRILGLSSSICVDQLDANCVKVRSIIFDLPGL